MDTEKPQSAEQEAEIYQFPTLKERAMRRHPASGDETIGQTLGRIGVDPAHEDPHAPIGSIFEQMGMKDDDGDEDKSDET